MSYELKIFIDRHRRLFVLTGAGCSVNSGIPDYRDANGEWKRTPPVSFQAFVADETTRLRYWRAAWLVGGGLDKPDLTGRITRWPDWSRTVNARCCSPKMWIGCTRRPEGGR